MSFETVCGLWDNAMDRTGQEAVAASMERALLCLNALADEALQGMSFFWQILPKAHMTTHMAYDLILLGRNPCLVTCYADEDMVGKMKIIAASCHGARAGLLAVRRYCILVGTRWWTRLIHLRFHA